MLDFTSVDTLESFQHENGCRILLVVRIALLWPTFATHILIRKLSFLSKLLSGTKDTTNSRVFTSLAMENIFEMSIVQQYRILEANLGTRVLAECLSDPENAPASKSKFFTPTSSSYYISLSSATQRRGPAAPAAHVATHTSWRCVWDVALDQGVKGTRTMQAIFKELFHPSSCFQCSQKFLLTVHACNMLAQITQEKWRTFPTITSFSFSLLQTLPALFFVMPYSNSFFDLQTYVYN